MTDSDRLTHERAYALWEAEGRPSGREHDHWDRAQRELGQQQSASTGSGEAESQNPSAPADGSAVRPPSRARAGRIAGSGTAKRSPRATGRKGA